MILLPRPSELLQPKYPEFRLLNGDSRRIQVILAANLLRFEVSLDKWRRDCGF